MAEQKVPQSLSDNTNLLGTLLGQTILEAEGEDCLNKIETIRALAKKSRSLSGPESYSDLADYLNQLSNEELLPIARAFSHFLNLANIADQHHMISREMDDEVSATRTLETLFADLQEAKQSKAKIQRAMDGLKIELVLTAHPTEITRRSLINKHAEIDDILSRLELKGITDRERQAQLERLAELIAQIWHTGDFREHRPTPVDEARWGFAVVENSLWEAVPSFMRRLEKTSQRCLGTNTGTGLPLHYAPISFTFWMGGDRDGNPNVTAEVTREVMLLSRWKAADLYLREFQTLIDELSMSRCNAQLRDMTGNQREPYRYILRQLRACMRDTLESLNSQLRGEEPRTGLKTIDSFEQLWQPLEACYRSLCESGMQGIANGKLRDLLHRVKSFGIHLVKFDIRQESDRHSQVMSELTQYLGLGDYVSWSEGEKQSFLLSELQSPRPLISDDWQPSEEVQEVLETCREISRQDASSLGVYVISMARAASDVLLVYLLMKACGCKKLIPVAPLFETLDDLNNAAEVIETLVGIPWYQQQTGSEQTVMIGYSDSAKDAGVMAAGWAQYRAQEALLKVCDKANFSLTLFHGRGGTIGRGGAPAHAALLSQPPGSLRQGLRVTEQGEMIRAKLGLSAIAIKSLALYTSAILHANLEKPPIPLPEWRNIMDRLSDISCQHYRSIVREEPNFVPWFRTATPELELGKLPLGSRPSRRKPGEGIETLRAIPWIFAWSQNRLMLPAWLGAGAALKELIDSGEKQTLEDMCRTWPFFATRISMLEMVFAKADLKISAYYDSVLAEPNQLGLGQGLRKQLEEDITTVLGISNEESPMQGLPQTRTSVDFRNTYVDPLNLLQAELLRRSREKQDDDLDQAIMVTIAGISAGLRNTG